MSHMTLAHCCFSLVTSCSFKAKMLIYGCCFQQESLRSREKKKISTHCNKIDLLEHCISTRSPKYPEINRSLNKELKLSVQSLSPLHSLQPHGLQHARPPCPSPTPEACSNSCPSVGDAIQPSHPLSSPSSPALNLSQHQGLSQ